MPAMVLEWTKVGKLCRIKALLDLQVYLVVE